ncbi:manganese superoxide dismutase [Aulographum hederae CBS 113979]|uniref:Superoxide dismutase n=1 Tax=Aulographum hederae CBS 113979 TaxID=1176131 RepID=A0A6G1GU23_9PEZI|nr:manganese superoxide dismutase [Aulographum hederae CBS 113979]
MAQTLLRSARPLQRLGLAATQQTSKMSSLSLVPGEAKLPDLSYDYGALEPAISGKIMELHHKNHHQTYVNSYNDASIKMQAAEKDNDIQSMISLQPLITFHGGGHINHSLFWENLAPTSQGGGEPPSGALAKAIDDHYGSLDSLKGKMNTALAGIQGSGWAWLVQDKQTGKLAVNTYANQFPVGGNFKPILGIDAWEHAYYLQYQNRKAEYFKAIWDVINWKAAEKRFT